MTPTLQFSPQTSDVRFKIERLSFHSGALQRRVFLLKNNRNSTVTANKVADKRRTESSLAGIETDASISSPVRLGSARIRSCNVLHSTLIQQRTSRRAMHANAYQFRPETF